MQHSPSSSTVHCITTGMTSLSMLYCHCIYTISNLSLKHTHNLAALMAREFLWCRFFTGLSDVLPHSQPTRVKAVITRYLPHPLLIHRTVTYEPRNNALPL